MVLTDSWNLDLLDITRTNLGYTVGLISQFMSKPIVEHLQCVQRILRYVSGIKDRALLYRTSVAEQLVSYMDAD